MKLRWEGIDSRSHRVCCLLEEKALSGKARSRSQEVCSLSNTMAFLQTEDMEVNGDREERGQDVLDLVDEDTALRCGDDRKVVVKA